MPDGTAPAHRSRLRTEALLLVTLLFAGVAVLPALVYLTGTVLLGSYPGGEHIGSFYGDLLRDLAQGSVRAWILVLGPYLLTQIGRLIFMRFGSRPAQDEAEPERAARSRPPARMRDAVRERREPTLGG